jgi:hypothetical protein
METSQYSRERAFALLSGVRTCLIRDAGFDSNGANTVILGIGSRIADVEAAVQRKVASYLPDGMTPEGTRKARIDKVKTSLSPDSVVREIASEPEFYAHAILSLHGQQGNQ